MRPPRVVRSQRPTGIQVLPKLSNTSGVTVSNAAAILVISSSTFGGIGGTNIDRFA